MFISNSCFLFVNTNRVITNTIKSRRCTKSKLTFRIFILYLHWIKPFTNTTMRMFITTSRNTFNPIVKIYIMSTTFFFYSSISFKFNSTFVVFIQHSINIKLISIINSKLFFPFHKFFTTK